MLLHSLSARAARILAGVFFITTVLLTGALVGGWAYVSHLALRPIPDPALPLSARALAEAPVSPLLLRYQLDLPGRGEIFPALTAGNAADYWPVGVLSIANNADRPVLQTISAFLPGWSRRTQQTVVIGPHQTLALRLSPELLPAAYRNDEIRRTELHVKVDTPEGATVFAQDRPVFLHSASDLYWGSKFANAQFLARWVTPHDEAVLQLVAQARQQAPGGRLAGYNMTHPSRQGLARQVRLQSEAIFQAMRRSGLTYVSSIYTYGNFADDAQRIRLPRETLSLKNANCIDVSVAFASAVENLGMRPVIVVVPGHAFAGVRLGPDSQEALYLDLTVLPRGSFAQANARAQAWFRKTSPAEVLTVDVSAARMLGIYPMPERPAQADARAAM